MEPANSQNTGSPQVNQQLRSDIFKLLDKPQLTPEEFSALHLNLHLLYTSGVSLSLENLAEEEKEIAQDHISDRTLDQIDENLFSDATNSVFPKEILNGLILYRVELLPLFSELVDRPLFISLLVKCQIIAEIAYARKHLSVLNMRVGDPGRDYVEQVQYWCGMIKRLTEAELDYDLDD